MTRAGSSAREADPDGRLLAVKRAGKRDGQGAWFIGPPKTVRSRRTLSLAPAVVGLLRPYLDRPADTYVFANTNGDPLRQNVFYEYRWQRAVALARPRGLMKKPRFHDLRHTHVAWLIAGGTPLPKIQQRLGPLATYPLGRVYRAAPGGNTVDPADDRRAAEREASVDPSLQARTSDPRRRGYSGTAECRWARRLTCTFG